MFFVIFLPFSLNASLRCCSSSSSNHGGDGSLLRLDKCRYLLTAARKFWGGNTWWYACHSQVQCRQRRKMLTSAISWTMRNTDVNTLIPVKFARMVSVRPDERMKAFFKETGDRMLRKWGFVAYDDSESAVVGEKDVISDEVPTFVGGAWRVDVLGCLKYLFRTEPEILALSLVVWDQLKGEGGLPCPKHMQ